jgi:hypothetical protein
VLCFLLQQQTGKVVGMLERNRPRIYTVRRGRSSLKDNQREELHQVETQQAEEDGGKESDGAELLLEEREGEVQQQQQQGSRLTKSSLNSQIFLKVLTCCCFLANTPPTSPSS